MLPDVILDKISWYIWKHRQDMICREYKIKIIINPWYYFDSYKCSIYYIGLNSNKMRINSNEIDYHFKIYNFTKGENTEINVPKNYIYSSGLNDLDGYKAEEDFYVTIS